jgi:hypothetical protein
MKNKEQRRKIDQCGETTARSKAFPFPLHTSSCSRYRSPPHEFLPLLPLWIKKRLEKSTNAVRPAQTQGLLPLAPPLPLLFLHP